MFQFRLPQLSSFTLSSFIPSATNSHSIPLPKAPVHAIEALPEKRARTLKHLLKANHINHAIIYNKLRFHNHVPHVLASAYILGADGDQLTHIYDTESRHLEPWQDSPGEISREDWHDYLGKREYQRAWVDFFEDQLVRFGYDWRALLTHFLLEGKEPLLNNLIAGLGHPLIHLGYAHELASRTVAVEGLALAACFRNDWHVYLDDPQYTKPAAHPTDSVFTILDRVAHDSAFDGLFDTPGSDNIATLLANTTASAALLEHWNSWDLKNPKAQFAESQKLAVALLVATQPHSSSTSNADPASPPHPYDFFALHLLTTSHAVRILLPLLPPKHHLPLLRQWWLFTLLVYIAQLRPTLNIDTIKLVELDGRDWPFVNRVALTSPYRTDAHFVKALRSIHEASVTWGDPNQFFLKAAVKFADEFAGWSGFGAADAELEAEETGGDGRSARRFSGQGDTMGLSGA